MTAVVPENAPETKLANIERLGGSYLKAPFEDFARVFATRSYPGASGRFIHPFSDPAVMAGNATIGLEILEDLPDVDTVVAAYGGGGLCCGIASAIKSARPDAKVYAAEAATSAPLAAALDAGEPTRIDYSLSFVDAIGSPTVQPEMFSLARRLLDGSLVVDLEQAAEAVRVLANRNHVVAEGGGAVPSGRRTGGNGGQRQGCVRGVGRQHRPGQAGDDPGGRRAVMESDLAVNGGPRVRERPWPDRRRFGPDDKAAVDALFDESIATGRPFRYDGPSEEAFCREFAEFMGGGFVDGVSSGSTALYVALKALGVEPFTEVIVGCLTDPRWDDAHTPAELHPDRGGRYARHAIARPRPDRGPGDAAHERDSSRPHRRIPG